MALSEHLPDGRSGPITDAQVQVPPWHFVSAIPGVAWPAVTAPGAATTLALEYQLERTQWLSADRLRELQYRQLAVVLQHSYATVPFYRERWRGVYDPGRALTPERFAALPLLTKRDLQQQFDNLKSRDIPSSHGATSESRTSGSTGKPVRVLKTELDQLYWSAYTLRDHLWHRRNLQGTLAAIRGGASAAQSDGWGTATFRVVETGRSAVLPASTDVHVQLAWLKQQQADYLLSHPSNIVELARLSIAGGVGFPNLKEVRTSGEILTQEVRDLCRQAWNAPVTDMYSANEVGYIAFQCPQYEHYHVQAEDVVVEILDEHGMPCAPGETGRIVVTPLHNFAMPLVRYDIEDFAEVGEPCACGRGLPVLRRIVGRSRNMLVTADGDCYWPSFKLRRLMDELPLLQYQFVQKEFDMIEARLVTASPFTGGQEENLRRHVLSQLPDGFRVNLEYCKEIPRGAGGKFEDYVSEVALPAAR